MKHASLFTGIGGFDLAAQWMGWENIFQCEIDDYCKRLLNQNFPTTVKHHDIKTTNFSIYRNRIDVLSGGFPCQPYSTAGKRLGKADERHLWPENYRAVREIQPPWVVGENVRGLTNWNGGLVFDEVQADLEVAGYEVTPFLLPAAGVNAPHRRDRIFFIAYSASFRRLRELYKGEGVRWGEQACGEAGTGCNQVITDPRCIFSNRGQGVNNGEDIGRQEKADFDKRLYQKGADPHTNSQHERYGYNGAGEDFGAEKKANEGTRHAISDFNNWPTQPGIRRGDDGISNRVHRLKGLGNAVVPQVVLQIFKAIQAYEDLKQ